MKLDLVGGQRTLVAILSILLLIAGAVLGQTGFPDVATSTPSVDSQIIAVDSQAVISPDFLMEAFGKVIAPLTLAIGALWGLFRALSQRVNNPSDPFKPNDLLSLLQSKEFWAYAVTACLGVAQVFGFKLVDAETQAVLVTSIMGVITFLLASWGSRPSGVTQDSTTLKLVELSPQATDEKPTS